MAKNKINDLTTLLEKASIEAAVEQDLNDAENELNESKDVEDKEVDAKEKAGSEEPKKEDDDMAKKELQENLEVEMKKETAVETGKVNVDPTAEVQHAEDVTDEPIQVNEDLEVEMKDTNASETDKVSAPDHGTAVEAEDIGDTKSDVIVKEDTDLPKEIIDNGILTNDGEIVEDEKEAMKKGLCETTEEEADAPKKSEEVKDEEPVNEELSPEMTDTSAEEVKEVKAASVESKVIETNDIGDTHSEVIVKEDVLDGESPEAVEAAEEGFEDGEAVVDSIQESFKNIFSIFGLNESTDEDVKEDIKDEKESVNEDVAVEMNKETATEVKEPTVNYHDAKLAQPNIESEDIDSDAMDAQARINEELIADMNKETATEVDKVNVDPRENVQDSEDVTDEPIQVNEETTADVEVEGDSEAVVTEEIQPEVAADVEVTPKQTVEVEGDHGTDVDFESLEEALDLPASYFLAEESRMEKLVEQVTLETAKTKESELYLEMVRHQVMADRCRAQLLEKYSEDGRNKANTLLETLAE